MPYNKNTMRDYECEEAYDFKEYYEYLCRNKIHPNPQIQYILEQQRSHITRDNYPKAILIVRHKITKVLEPIHIYGKPK